MLWIVVHSDRPCAHQAVNRTLDSLRELFAQILLYGVAIRNALPDPGQMNLRTRDARPRPLALVRVAFPRPALLQWSRLDQRDLFEDRRRLVLWWNAAGHHMYVVLEVKLGPTGPLC